MEQMTFIQGLFQLIYIKEIIQVEENIGHI